MGELIGNNLMYENNRLTVVLTLNNITMVKK